MNESDKYDEQQLLLMLANDSQYAFQLLFNKYKNHIYKVSSLYIKSPMLGEEVLQEVFLKVWLNRKKIVNLTSFESWLFVVSKNIILNHYKRLASEWKAVEHYCLQERYMDDDADYKIRTRQYDELLQKVLARLPEQQQTVYRLAREQNMSYKDIASILSISNLTVKTHMARALNSIRSYLKQQKLTTFFIYPLICGNLF